ncbi:MULTISPECIES: hypothetical protein [unclassified Paenibacillus]|nr:MULTISPECIES: hypothetical protein [unclassified Paenibacillus]MDF9845527.1 phage baseplate assembly protein gpV [Paenibacillus sp. PastF-2]MDF9852103.1 phage baseplate assembly protein gpV [Paenibacillus sp. PastM-2]
MIRTGIVSTVNTASRTVRVIYPDKDNLVSGELPVIGPTMIGIVPVELPAVGESVLVVYPDNSTDGYCLGVIPGGVS